MPSESAGSALRRRFEEADAPPAAVTSDVVAPPVTGASIREAYPTDVPDVPRATTSMTPAEIISSASRQPLADVIASPEAQSADIPQSQAPGPPLTADNLRAALAPAPNTTYGEILPLASDNATGALRFAMLGAVRNILRGGVDLLQGPGGMVMTPGGTSLLTPEATGALATVAGVRSPASVRAPELIPPGLAAREAPLSPEFRAAPGKIEPSTTGPVSANPHPLQAPKPAIAPGNTLAVGSDGKPLPVEGQPAVASVIMTPEQAAAKAKAVASAYYTKADQVGGTLSPEFTNKFIDTIKGIAPQTAEGAAFAGTTPITELVARAESLRGKPISLQSAQEIDEALGNMIDKEYGVKGLSKDGKALLDLQTTFRNQIADTTQADTSGGASGFDALVQARKAWSQAMKITDLQRIQERSTMIANPATSVITGIRTLLSNPSRVRGYSDEEIAALHKAADRGVLGDAFHVFGNRLIPWAAGVTGFAAGAGTTGGLLSGLAAAGASHAATTGVRAMATRLQARRLQNAVNTLAAGIPEPPT